MKIYIVMCGEQYECSWTVKVFKSKTKAELYAEWLTSHEEYGSPYSYFLREIEADLEE